MLVSPLTMWPLSSLMEQSLGLFFRIRQLDIHQVLDSAMEAAAVADLSSEKLKGEMWQQRKVHGNEGSASSFMEKDLVSGPESSHVEYSGLKERKDGGALDDGCRVGRGERVASFSSVIPGINGKTESLREGLCCCRT